MLNWKNFSFKQRITGAIVLLLWTAMVISVTTESHEITPHFLRSVAGALLFLAVMLDPTAFCTGKKLAIWRTAPAICRSLYVVGLGCMAVSALLWFSYQG